MFSFLKIDNLRDIIYDVFNSKYEMTLGEFLKAESKNSRVTYDSELGKSVLIKIKDQLNKGNSVAVVLKGIPYKISPNKDGSLNFEKIK